MVVVVIDAGGGSLPPQDCARVTNPARSRVRAKRVVLGIASSSSARLLPTVANGHPPLA